MLRSGKAVLKTVLFLSFCFVLAITGAVEALAAAQPEPAQIEIAVQSRIIGHEYNGEQYYLAFDIKNAFEFTLSPINRSPMPKNNRIIAGEIVAGNSESDVTYFDEIVFDKTGEYKYTVRETDKSGDFPYFTFDAAEHEITVQVVEHEGKLEASVDYGTPEADYLVIENKYEAYDLEVFCKSIGGSDYDEYSIAISFYDGNDCLDPYTYTYIQNDGTEIKSETGTSGKTVTLKNGEGVVIPALPKGSNYSVEGKKKEGYRIAYDANRNGSELKSNITTEVTFADESLSCTLEIPARVQLYGHNESGKYYYPGTTTIFPLQLEAITGNAPMPGGVSSPYIVRGWGFNALKGTGNQYRSIIGHFGEIVFTEEDLLINPSGVFEYKVTRTGEEYSFIEYDFRDNYHAPEYTITVEVKKENGKLVAAFKEDTPLFRHRFDATRMRIVKRVTGKGADETLKFPVTFTLLEQRENEDTKTKAIPVKNWVVVAEVGQVDSSNIYRPTKTVTYTTNSSGTITMSLGHRDYVTLYNLPNDKYYEVSENEADDSGYYPSYIVRAVETDDERALLTVDNQGRINTDYYYYVYVTNARSKVPPFTIPEEICLEVGQKTKVPIENNSSAFKLSWDVEDKEIATINQNGMVKGVAEGETVVLLSDSNYGITRRTVVRVIPVITEIAFSLDDEEGDEGEEFSLIPYETYELTTAAISGDDDYMDGNGILTLKSSSEEVATIDQDGIIRAKAPGETIITATSPRGFTASRELTVREAMTIRIPDGTKIIEESAFRETPAEIYIIPDSVEEIEDYAFGDLPNARFIVMPWSAVKASYLDAFTGTDALFVLPDGEIYEPEELW